jgi:hypothetical protein
MQPDAMDIDADVEMKDFAAFRIPDPEPLIPGEILPELDEMAAPAANLLSSRGPKAQSPVFQVDPETKPAGSSIKYYAIGIAASIVAIGLAYLAVHL